MDLSDFDNRMTRQYVKWTEDKIQTAKNLANNGCGARQIAEATSVSIRSAQKFLEEYIESGNFSLGSRIEISAQNERLKSELQRMLTNDCSLSLPQMQEKLPVGSRCSVSKISRAIKEMGWSRKRVKSTPAERNSQRVINIRHEYVCQIGNRSLSDLVYLDETGFNLHIAPKYGWAPLNVTPSLNIPANRGKNISVLAAISIDGLIGYKIVEGSVTSEIFSNFLIDDLIPKMRQDQLLIMDNAKIHHTEMIKTLLLNRRISSSYLPPYSPHLNPIEEVFGMVKSRFRKSAPRPQNKSELIALIDRLFDEIRGYNMFSFYEHSKTFYQVCYNKHPLI